MLSTGVRSVLTLLSRGVNLPLPVFAQCAIERCGFGNLPKTVRRQLYSKKERESGPNWEPATPRTLRGLRRKLIGMLTGAAPHCGPRPGATSPAIRWSVFAVKLSGRGGVGNMSSRPDFWWKNVKMDVKTSFFDVVSEVQKDSQDVSAGISQIKNNLTYKNFVRNLTSKLARSTLTSPGWIRVKIYTYNIRVDDENTFTCHSDDESVGQDDQRLGGLRKNLQVTGSRRSIYKGAATLHSPTFCPALSWSLMFSSLFWPLTLLLFRPELHFQYSKKANGLKCSPQSNFWNRKSSNSHRKKCSQAKNLVVLSLKFVYAEQKDHVWNQRLGLEVLQ